MVVMHKSNKHRIDNIWVLIFLYISLTNINFSKIETILEIGLTIIVLEMLYY